MFQADLKECTQHSCLANFTTIY